RTLAASVRMHPALADYLQGLAVQGEGHGHGIRAIRDVDDVVDDGHTVRVCDGTDAPAVEVVTVAVEDHHGRIRALEDIDAILGISRHCADDPQRLPSREFGEVLDEFVSIFAGANLCHLNAPSWKNAPPRPTGGETSHAHACVRACSTHASTARA